MPNNWIEHVKPYSKLKGMKYGEALRCADCKSTYKLGGASPYTTQPGKVTLQNGKKVGFGLDEGRESDKQEAAIDNATQLGANAGTNG